MAKMHDLSIEQIKEQQEAALECIMDAYERKDTLDEAYFTLKLLSADAVDMAKGNFEGKPLENDQGFLFLL